jgi:hypothetical protein
MAVRITGRSARGHRAQIEQRSSPGVGLVMPYSSAAIGLRHGKGVGAGVVALLGRNLCLPGTMPRLDLRQMSQAGRANISAMQHWDWVSIAVCAGLIASALTLVAISVSLV